MVNKVILVGNVGIDPEVRTLEGGAKVARVRLATTERLYDRASNETKEHTEWHTITLWRGLADVVDRYVRKGTQLYIEGRLRTREWMDKDNNKRYTTEILADTMNLLGRRSDNPASDGAAPGYGAQGQGSSRRGSPAAAAGRTFGPGRRSRRFAVLTGLSRPVRRPSGRGCGRSCVRTASVAVRDAAGPQRSCSAGGCAAPPRAIRIPFTRKGSVSLQAKRSPFFPWWRRPPCASGFTAGPVTEFSVRGVRFPAGIRSDRLRSGRRALRRCVRSSVPGLPAAARTAARRWRPCWPRS